MRIDIITRSQLTEFSIASYAGSLNSVKHTQLNQKLIIECIPWKHFVKKNLDPKMAKLAEACVMKRGKNFLKAFLLEEVFLSFFYI